ncbi:HD domain-containing protein [Oligoflexus tunisiensis]|uniref:HD domain-containing protein n=1 Tax=Oligoflexus tunisiensis TaxID=708132 RepID=UPI00114CAB80|nr:HD domain-containing protein [Oligoflexus tunisiensis]
MVKLIRDSIHGDIEISDNAAKVIKMPLFQRLRGIKQTGLLYLVYPGMQHSRFEHSLGAYCLAKRNFENFLTIDWDRFSGIKEDIGDISLKIGTTRKAMEKLSKDADYWRDIFEISALIHDVGHGPFSHTFEDAKLLKKENFVFAKAEEELTHLDFTIIKFLKESNSFKHENISLLYLNEIARELGYSKETTQDIAMMIHPKYRKEMLIDYLTSNHFEEKRAITLLLSIFISGPFDVDRMDYMVRDSLMAGVNYGKIEPSRFLRSLVPVLTLRHGVFNVGIVSQIKTLHIIDHFFVNLNSLYKILYYHPSALRISYEFTEALKLQQDELVQKTNIWTHRTLDESEFLQKFLDARLKKFVDEIFTRQCKAEDPKVAFELSSLASAEMRQTITQKSKYVTIPIPEREIVKDVNVIYIAEKFKLASMGEFKNWKDLSIVAGAENFKSDVMWRNDLFTERLAQIKQELMKKAS